MKSNIKNSSITYASPVESFFPFFYLLFVVLSVSHITEIPIASLTTGYRLRLPTCGEMPYS